MEKIDRTFILGAADPEMESIERLLRETGARVIHALGPDGTRVRADSAYRVAALSEPVPPGSIVYRVECDGPAIPPDAAVIDHHRPGDPGYGLPPEKFLPASSIGQVISELARTGALPDSWGDAYDGKLADQIGGMLYDTDERAWGLRAREDWIAFPCGPECCGYVARPMVAVPREYVLVAAADHCLAAAYRGECPGVEPDALMRWRAESRARFQRRTVEDVLADVERAREALRTAPTLDLDNGVPCSRHHPATPGRNARWHDVDCDSQSPCRLPLTARDLRGQHVPELPEASAREGECFVADGLPGPDGRVKVVCQSGTPEQIDAFMRVWAPAQGLTDIYGDPARGFAGGYRADREVL